MHGRPAGTPGFMPSQPSSLPTKKVSVEILAEGAEGTSLAIAAQ